MGVLLRELAALYARRFAAGGRRRCRSCRSSTPTSPPGSARWLAGRGAGARSSPTGAGGWRARRRSWSCRPTGRGRPVAELRGRRRSLPCCRRSWPRPCGRSRRREGATLVHGPARRPSRPCSTAHSGQDDLAVGTPVAGRDRAETEGLIGFFVNTLVLRARPRGRPGLPRAAGRARETALGPTPTRTCRSSGWSRSCSRSATSRRRPLFQVIFALAERAAGALALPGLGAASRCDGRQRTAQVRSHPVARRDGRTGLAGALEYSPTCSTRHGRAPARPVPDLLAGGRGRARSGALSELPLLGAAERQQLLVEWTSDGAAAAPGRAVHELFAARAARTPERAGGRARRRGGSDLRRARRAGQPARPPSARAAASGRSVPVGDLPGALAGADGGPAGGAQGGRRPTCRSIRRYPPSGWRFVLADCPGAVLVPPPPAGAPAARLAGIAERRAVRSALDASEASPERVGGLGPERRWRPDARRRAALPSRASRRTPAYVIYTSGSTGRPKGVVIEHRSARRRHAGAGAASAARAPDDVCASSRSLAFDSRSGRSGGRCSAAAAWCWCPPGRPRRRRAPGALLAEQRVDRARSTPSALLRRPSDWPPRACLSCGAALMLRRRGADAGDLWRGCAAWRRSRS